ncbi:hypothetical protein QUF72_09900 [Desulfobacterales bacterium HSG2]|nr:hypothetical protein [Desulfobacterales bacterium HSG2]
MSLKEKLQKLKENRTHETDWEARKNEWIRATDELYGKIRTWFADLEGEYLTFSFHKKNIEEESVGTYEINRLEIIFDDDDNAVIFDPVGTNIVSAYGRIDFYLRGCKADKCMIVRFREDDGSYQWEILKGGNGKRRTKLEKDVLEKIMEAWIDEKI